MPNIRNLPFFYGYVVVATTFCITVVMHGIMFSFGVFFTPILEEFGWDRALLSGVNTMHTVMYGSLSLAAGRLTDRIGPRVSVVIAGICFGLGTLFMSQVSTIWQLYLFGGVLRGIGMGFCVVPLTSLIPRWFIKRRNLMMGIALSGMGTGMLVMPLVINSLIDAHGWRDTAFIMGIVAVVFIALVAQLIRRDPEQMGLLPDGEERIEGVNVDFTNKGFAFNQAIRSKQFRMITIAYVSSGFMMSGAMVHIAPHAIEMGISAGSAASIISIIGVGGMVSRLAFGRLADKKGNVFLLITSVVLLLSCAFLLYINTQLWQFYIVAVLFGFGQGGMSVTMAPIVAELFGLKEQGTIQGFLVFITTVSTAASPMLAGGLFDISGSYQLAWLVFGVIATIGLVVTLVLKHAGGRITGYQGTSD